MTDLELMKNQVSWLTAHLRSRIVNERGGGSSSAETLMWAGIVTLLVIGVGAGITAYVKSKMPH